MFGYVVANIEDLTPEEKVRYRAVYCGLCRTLGTRCGQRCRFGLTYDMAFLALLLGSLYEPDEAQGEKRCALHPLKAHEFAASVYTDYAADLTVALMYHKCLDNWYDDRSVPSRGYAAVLAASYRKVQQRWSRQCEAIERELAAIRALEEANAAVRKESMAVSTMSEGEDRGTTHEKSLDADGRDSTIGNVALDTSVAPHSKTTTETVAYEGTAVADEAAKCFGRLMGELFVYEPDLWADQLRLMGMQLGRFIYVMDAVCDYEDDQKKGSFNPLFALDYTQDTMEEALTLLIGSTTEVFEKLPLERDMHLLRSVLYAGVWQKYNARFKKDEG